MLIPDYYRITGTRKEDRTFIFDLEILPGCRVYQGHFPKAPICPGVCNIEMIKECVEQATGQELTLDHIQQCRLTSLMTPGQHRNVQLKLELLNDEIPCKVKTCLFSGDTVFIDMKCELSK